MGWKRRDFAVSCYGGVPPWRVLRGSWGVKAAPLGWRVGRALVLPVRDMWRGLRLPTTQKKRLVSEACERCVVEQIRWSYSDFDTWPGDVMKSCVNCVAFAVVQMVTCLSLSYFALWGCWRAH